jgi:hypothetical protein
MTNKNFWLGMLIIALVLGTVVIGCDNGTTGNATPGGSVGGPADITYTVEANGEADKDTSTQLTFTFSAVTDLELEDIIIIPVTGKASRDVSVNGTLTGDGTSWTLLINKVTEGKIRVIIEKEGIERGRKTVNVYKNSTGGGNSGQAIPLLNNRWEEGRLDSKEDEKWYMFEAVSGENYFVERKDKSGAPIFTDKIYVKVTAWESDAITQIENFDEDGQGSYRPALLSGVSGTVYLKVETAWWSSPGTFSIKFYAQSSIKGPRDIIRVNEAKAMADISLKVSWSVNAKGEYLDPLESVGCKLYRSDTEDGEYKEIADVTEIPEHRYDSWVYIDKNVMVGKTYWYKVAGYDSEGEIGAMSEPKESELLQDVDAGIVVLTVGGRGEGDEFTLTNVDQVHWYKFEAEPGITYWVEQDNRDHIDGTPYGAAVNIFGFTSDKTPIAESTVALIEGLSGTIYLKVVWVNDPRNRLGPYKIRVYEFVRDW